jgi:sugar phosphate permease
VTRLGYYGWWVMLGCIACQVNLGFAKDTMDVYMTYIVSEFGWGRADFQLAGWALLTTFGVTSPAIGYLLDRFGARTVLTLGAVALGATFSGYAAMTSFTQYLLITPLMGIGIVAMGDIPASTIVARWFERRRGTVIGIVLIGSNLGAAVVNLLAKGLYRGFGEEWRPALLVLAAIMVLMVLPFSLWIIRDPRPGELPRSEPDGGVLDAAAHGADAPPRPVGPVDRPVRETLGSAAFWVLGFALFAYYFHYLFVNRHIIALLRDSDSFGYRVPAAVVALLGVSARDFPEFTKSMFEIVGLPAKLLAGILVDRYRIRHALAWNFLLLVLCALMLPLFGRVPGVLWVFIVAQGVAWAAQQVLTPMTIAQCFGLRHMGQIYGTLMLALFPAHLSPWYAGYVFDRTGSYIAFFPACIVLTLAATASLFLLPRVAAPRR